MAPAFPPASSSRSSIFRPLSTPALFTALATSAPALRDAADQEGERLQAFDDPLPSSRRRRTQGAREDPLDEFDVLPREGFPHDLGDDDSFSPHIVSGYHFPVPLARDEHDSSPSEAQAQSPVQGEQLREGDHDRDRDHDHDHRVDAVYDDLDDIGDWVANTTPNADLTKKLAKAVARSTGPATGIKAADAVLNVHRRNEEKRKENIARDKLDRATVEQVLDPRTRMILFRLLSRNRLRTLDGCVSTGKEANVYYATAASHPDLPVLPDGTYQPNPDLRPHDISPDAGVAVKVFKTSILQFKDRERYVDGEFRFRRSGYQRGSNRKMVQQWAEKEFRNQMRLQEAGIPAPVPLLLKPPVLIMSFFGQDGWPAPRLKDASLSSSKLRKAYFRVCILMRRMFRVAHLVHGDLSEYNMLYWRGEVIIIDVSQSVEDDHPMALDFLRRDCANVNDYFRRNGGGPVLSVRELFDFVTGEHIGDGDYEQETALQDMLEAASGRDTSSTRNAEHDDEVFMRSYIPRTLQDVEVRERDLRQRNSPDLDDKLFAKLTGLEVAQKQERQRGQPSSSRIRTPSLDEETKKQMMTLPVDGEVEHGNVVDLEVPLSEPATVRGLPRKDRTQVRAMSPVTSSSSLRPQDDKPDAERLSRMIEQQAKLDHVGFFPSPDPASSLAHESTITESVVRVEESELFLENDRSESSSGDMWIRPDPQETVDPYDGLTKKEWKKRVKAENREKRENKTPKHVKKRKELLAKRRRGTK